MVTPSVELAPGVYSLGVPKVFQSHAFLIDDGGELTLIDTLYAADAGVIVNQIRAIGRSLTDLKHIVLTHAHRSHLGGLAALKRLSGATVYSHAWEADIVAGERAVQPSSWLPQDPLITYPYQIANNLHISSPRPCRVDEMIADGDTIGPLTVIHTPGHTPGHLAFWMPASRVLFCGDAVVTSPKFMAGWPGLVLNKQQHAASVRRLAGYEADVLAVGHGKPVTKDAAARLRSLLPTV